MPILKKEKLITEVFCDLCGVSQGTSELSPDEYPDWLVHTTDLLTFNVEGWDVLLCWECIKKHGLTKEYDRRLNALTYPKDKE